MEKGGSAQAGRGVLGHLLKSTERGGLSEARRGGRDEVSNNPKWGRQTGLRQSPTYRR